MNKQAESAKINIQVTVDEAAIKAAVMNAENLKGLALPLPIVDPEKLTIKSQIYGIKLLPITPKEGKLETPDAGMYVSLYPVTVGVIDGISDKDNYIINGTVKVPLNPGTVVGLKTAFFASETDARLVCKTITIDQMERRNAQIKLFEEQIETEVHEHAFLDKQYKDDRY